VILLLLLTTLQEPGNPEAADACAASIRVLGQTPGNALFLGAALVTRGPRMVFIPSWKKVGFRVVRSKSDELGKLLGEVIKVRSRELRRPSLLYDFEHPMKLRVWWTDVGVETLGNQESLVVPVGRYRFSIAFSETDPQLAKGETVELCRVFSDEFVISEPSHFLQLP
jgi:hypothetical protein